MMATELDKRLSKTTYLVEATHEEAFHLWRQFHNELDWKNELSGWMTQVGQLDGRPVMVQFWWIILNDKRIAFYESTSQVVDHLMIENWLEAKLPGVPKTNSANFHHAVHFAYGGTGNWPKKPLVADDIWELVSRSKSSLKHIRQAFELLQTLLRRNEGYEE